MESRLSNVQGRLGELQSAWRRGDRIVCIHYACENFFDVTDRPAAITCIALAECTESGQDRVYSLANAPASTDAVDREKDLLTRFYDELRGMPDARLVHWNMHSANFGFSAIAARYRFLFNGDAPVSHPPDRLYDLDALVEAVYGEEYARHPKLRSLATLNALYMPFFKTGKAEADAYGAGDYGLIERSTSEKAHLISLLFLRTVAGDLQTQTSVGSLDFANTRLDAVRIVLALADRFVLVSRSLSVRYNNRETLRLKDEYDAQDLFRSLLKVFFEDVRAEDPVSKYAGGASRIDFVLPTYRLGVELKYARPSMRAKDLGDELTIDIAHYQDHHAISHLICLVFDGSGYIDNPRGIETDLHRDKSDSGLAVTVKIIDR